MYNYLKTFYFFVCTLHVAIALFFSANSSQAQSNTEDSTALVNSLVNIVNSEAYVLAGSAFCMEEAPNQAAYVLDAVQTWETQQMALIRHLTAHENVAPLLPSLNAIKAELIEENHVQIKDYAGWLQISWCLRFSEALSGPEYDISRQLTVDWSLMYQLVTHLYGYEPEIPRQAYKRLPQAQHVAPLAMQTYDQFVAMNIDPEQVLINDTFFCYAEQIAWADRSAPHLTLNTAAGGGYQSSFGSGRYQIEENNSGAEITWQGAINSTSILRYKEGYGQFFSLNEVYFEETSDQEWNFWCYQQGAAHDYALASFALKTVKVANYTCSNTGEDNSQTALLEILENHRYSFAGEVGFFKPTGIFDRDDNSSVDWLSRPLAGLQTDYQEEEGTGFRLLSMYVSESDTYISPIVATFGGGNSSELSLYCTAVGEPFSRPRFGEASAPSVPQGDDQLSGLYILDQTPELDFEFVWFFENGYVYVGDIDDPNQIDCTRTFPNGAPFCAPYIYRNGTLETNGDTLPLQKTADGFLIGQEKLTPVTPIRQPLVGRYKWLNTSTTGICGPNSFCSMSSQENTYVFMADGRFSYEGASSSNSFAMDSYSSSSNSVSSDSGSFDIEGNVITLRYDNGKVAQRLIFDAGGGSIYLEKYRWEDED